MYILLLFCGNQKPDPIDDYLEEFPFDLVELRKESYNEKTYNVELLFLHVFLESELL